MAAIRCLRCDAVNYPGKSAAVCERCGEKLPAADAIGIEPDEDRPDDHRRTLMGEVPPHLDVRKRDDPSDEARKKSANETSGMLIAIALLQAVCGGFSIYTMSRGMGPDAIAVAVVVLVALVAMYAGLGVWARWMPIPAGIIGLVLYVGLSVLEIVVAASAGGPGGFPRGMILRVFVAIGLIRCIYGAAKAS